LIPEKVGVIELRADWSKLDGKSVYSREAYSGFPPESDLPIAV
jgi:hypothetical protein